MFKSICTLLVLITILTGFATSDTQAQAARRWLADPALITNTKMIGPGAQQTFDIVLDIAPINASDGWAVSYGSILRYDGRFWRRAMQLSSTTTLSAIAMEDASHGWIVGHETERQPPYNSAVQILRYSGNSWFPVNGSIRRIDGSIGALDGRLHDVVAYPGSALAIGVRSSDIANWTRPLVLSYKGQEWHDITPAEWRYGMLNSMSMVSPNEGWVSGLLGYPGGEGANAVRPVVLHYRDGYWIEEQVVGVSSGTPFSMGQILMTSNAEGWAVYSSASGPCFSAQLLRFSGGIWARQEHEYANSMVLGLIPGTNRGWASLGGCSSRGNTTPDRRMYFNDGVFTSDVGGASLVPSVYGILNDELQWAGASGSMLRYSAEMLPTAPLAAAPTGARFFSETMHSLAGDFRSYYESHGIELGDRGISARESLGLFGYPVSEAFDEINPDTGELYRVQYFERARMELHPENQPPYRVLLGRLAFGALRSRNLSEPQIPNPNQGTLDASCQRFPETGYDLCVPLRSFWERSGGLAVFGLPLVNARNELSNTDGKSYLTQWFERERLEYHPELRGSAYEVLLGLLGSEELRTRGYLP